MLAQFAPFPLRPVFLVYLLAPFGMAMLTAKIRETVESPIRSPAKLSFEPRIGVPSQLRVAFVVPAITAFATLALLGFYAALLPNLIANSMHLHSPALSGAVVVELFAVSAATVIATPMLSARTAMFSGLWLLPPGLALLLWAQVASSLALLTGATVLCGIACALGFRGSLQEVNRIAPARQRAELISAYLLCCYSGNSVPAVGIALLSRGVGHLWVNAAFAAVSAALAVGARHASHAS